MKVAHGMHTPSTTLLNFLRRQLNHDLAAQSSSSKQCILNANNASRRTFCHQTATKSRAVTPIRTALSRRCNSRINVIERSSATLFRRSFSTKGWLQQNWWYKQMRSGESTRESKYRDDDLLPLLGLDDQSGLGGRILKPSNDNRIRCTEFDENGNIVLVSGEFKKHELIARYSLLPRDLRKIDSSVLPSILVRPSAILINLLHIRCLIKHDRVLVFDVYGSTDSYAQSLFMYDLEAKLKLKQSLSTAGGPLPYEFRALEAVLISVTNGLENEFEGVREPVLRVLRDLEEDIDREKLRHLLIYSKKLGTFEQKARLVRDAIDELLEADDDLAAMYLTEKQAGGGRDEDNHEEIELLLESYYNVADEICQVASNLVSSIKNTEEIMRAILDSNRNSLMLLDLQFSVLTLGTGVGMFIAALYGMNLVNYMEQSQFGFFEVTGISAALTLGAIALGMKRIRKVQRVRMYHNRRSLREARAKIDKVRKETWRQLEHDTGGQGLGETVAGIRAREAIASWKRDHQERAKQFANVQTQAAKQAQYQAMQQAKQVQQAQKQMQQAQKQAKQQAKDNPDDPTLPYGA